VLPVPGELAGSRVVTLPGLLDESSAAQVLAALTEGLAGGTAAVIADLAATTYCSLEGLAALLQARAVAAAAGAQLRLAGAGPAVRQLLERTGTGQVLAAYATVTAARDGLPGAPG
jgi:anti-sigma B factor antagonist